MKLYLSEITEEPREFEFTEAQDWLKELVFSIDEKLPSESSLLPSASATPTPTPRVIDAKFKARKMDRIFWLDGKLSTSIQLLCSRCAAPFFLDFSADFSNLYTKDPVIAGLAEPAKHADGEEEGGWRWSKGVKGHQNTHLASADGSTESDVDLELTLVKEDALDLCDVAEEQLRLQVPAQPLCKDTCKGLCPQCGKDLNFEACGCEVGLRVNPFAVLKAAAPPTQ